MSALPGLPHEGEPEAFMPARAFACISSRPTRRRSTRPSSAASRLRKSSRRRAATSVTTNAGQWQARSVIIATGACDTPYRPAMASGASHLDRADFSHALSGARSAPERWRAGCRRFVDRRAARRGASRLGPAGDACGRRSHARAAPLSRPRYLRLDGNRGRPRRPPQEGGNLDAARRQPSLQLVGRPDNRDLNLGMSEPPGRPPRRTAGRHRRRKAGFSGDLERTTAASHSRMVRLLDRIDACIESRGLEAPRTPIGLPASRSSPLASRCTVDLQQSRIGSVVWATGYVRRYPWLNVPVLDSRGEIVHRGGVATVPGLFVLGLTFLRRRRSHFIDGCGIDANEIAGHVRSYLEQVERKAA